MVASTELSTHERKWLEQSRRCEREGWIYLRITGEPFSRGFQHGYCLAREIEAVLRVNRFLTLWQTGNEWSYFTAMADEMYTPKTDPEFIEEMRGIAAGASKAGVPIAYQDVLAWNANIEMMGSWWPLVQGNPPQPKLRNHRCSAMIATGERLTSDGGIVLAHNTWDTYANGSHANILLDIEPQIGHRVLMQTSPGYIHSGTDFFLVSSGIIGAETTISGFNKYDATKAPEFSRVRKAMQYAQDLDQWMNIMQQDNNGGYANSWLLGDVNSAEIVRFELGLEYVGIERTRDGFFWGCNIVSDLKIRNQEAVDTGYSDVSQDAGRRVRWQQLVKKHQGNINLEVAKDMLGDHHDVYNRQEKPCTRSICGHFDQDAAPFSSWGFPPFYPFGANDGKVTTSELARKMHLSGRFGHPCGLPFSAKKFLEDQPQYDWLASYLEDKPHRAWTDFPVES